MSGNDAIASYAGHCFQAGFSYRSTLGRIGSRPEFIDKKERPVIGILYKIFQVEQF